LIGNFQLPVKDVDISALKEDGFLLRIENGKLHILGGEGKGTLYGVVSLLEDYFNIHYYADQALSLTESPDMILPDGINRLENPSFRYRQTQGYSTRDSLFRIWHRLESPNEVFVNNLWVHTFNRLLPATEFGQSHPEYYAFVNGERRPGAASQWCLTNPEVFEIVSHRIDSLFKANPGQQMLSVSQNDSQTHCECDACRAMDEHEGSPSGTIIYFLNKLAERFPDKEFSTLAYLYSTKPPAHIHPLPNVNIMLCDIDCYREVPLTENLSGQKFVHEMEGWAKLTNNIFVWDYGINFDNYVSPFPNLHILQPNMELFQRNHVTMHFSQISGVKGGDFSELRTYLVSKLLWNTSINTDSLIQSFLRGYYGEAAAPYLYQYIKLREGALMGSRIPLWIYDTPVTHKNGMLNPIMMRRYQELFDQAEQLAAGEPLHLARVQQARLPIQYAELEIARTEPIEDIPALRDKLNLFVSRAATFGVTILNERRNTIAEYGSLYAARNFSHERKSLARGSTVSYTLPPDKPYDALSPQSLTDGLYGGSTFNESWIGWVGKDAELVIDLGESREIHRVEADFLHKLGSWILLPKAFRCEGSTDGEAYREIGSTAVAEDRDAEIKYVSIGIDAPSAVSARYLKIHIQTLGLCPPWHYGVGHPAWFFIDEINVY
jgi:hypothetical protein